MYDILGLMLKLCCRSRINWFQISQICDFVNYHWGHSICSPGPYKIVIQPCCHADLWKEKSNRWSKSAWNITQVCQYKFLTILMWNKVFSRYSIILWYTYYATFMLINKMKSKTTTTLWKLIWNIVLLDNWFSWNSKLCTCNTHLIYVGTY